MAALAAGLASCGSVPIPAAILPPPAPTFTPPVEILSTVEFTSTAELQPQTPEPLPVLPTSMPATLASLSFYPLPDWMKDPQTPILMQWIRKAGAQPVTATLSFLNAATGEWADLPFPLDAGYYFWFDTSHFGYLSKDLATLALVDLATGQGSLQPVPAEATRLIEPSGSDLEPLQVKRVSNSPAGYVFDYFDTPNLRTSSLNGRYTSVVEDDTLGNPMTILDNLSGQTVWTSNRTDGLWENEFAWSPVRESYIAFARGAPEGDWSVLVLKNSLLQVVDVSTRDVVAEYAGNVGSIRWSPDGRYILYLDASSRYASLGYPFQGAPCIYDILSHQHRCLTGIPVSTIPVGYQLKTTGLYTWSPDGLTIRYMALYSNPATGSIAGNVCQYNLVNGSIFCPTAGLQGPASWGISYYDFSPDGRFLNYCYSEKTILEDRPGKGYDALIDAGGMHLITWIGLAKDGNPICSSYKQVWRPLP